MKSKRVTIQTVQIKATEQYFPEVLFVMLYRVVLIFESVDEILNWCDFWRDLCNESLIEQYFFFQLSTHGH